MWTTFWISATSRTLLPELAKLRHGVEIFYNKANLTHDQIRLLRDAGIVPIQPGIETLSTPMLELMDKGITAFQNVRLLRYTAEFGIGTAWNLLYGFPREDPQQFQMMAELLPVRSATCSHHISSVARFASIDSVLYTSNGTARG